jgi:RimJ/RimL family protein N-acetyltransferase
MEVLYRAMHIATERLSIRPWEAMDRAAFERMVADPDMMRHLTHGRAWRPDEVDEFMARQARHLAGHGCCMGALVARDTGEVVGVAGIQPLDAPGEYEFGWWVWKDHWGRGYATEAARALAAHARGTMRLPHIHAVIDPHNTASIRVAERVGMRFVRVASARDTVARREDIPVAYYMLAL